MPDFPKPPAAEVDTDAVASAVWAYGTRELTGFTGTPRSDLVGADENIYTRLDVAVSTRSSHAAADVWSVATRTLTGFTGTPRTDLLGEDADFESGTGTRKARIDRLANMFAELDPLEGSVYFLTTDSYPEEKTVVDSTLGVPHKLEGFVDLSDVDGSIDVMQYMQIQSGGSYRKYAEELYEEADVSNLPALYVVSKPGRYGIKITLKRDTAPSRNVVYPYQIFRRRIE